MALALFWEKRGFIAGEKEMQTKLPGPPPLLILSRVVFFLTEAGRIHKD